jgi:glutamate-5-semialdehyde dehydrogenase
MIPSDYLYQNSQKIKVAAHSLSTLSHKIRTELLLNIASNLEASLPEIISANNEDLAQAKKKGLSNAILDRLIFTETRILASAKAVRDLVELPDVLNKVLTNFSRPNGLSITKVSVPIGVIGIIYENRPNVTVDSIAIAIKTGNGLILRGSSDAINSNKAIVSALSPVLTKFNIPAEALIYLDDIDRSGVEAMLTATGIIDILIPRGSASFINYARANSRVPLIETGSGNCHLYVAQDAKLDMATKIAINSKASRPSVCNAIETILIHHSWPHDNILSLLNELVANGISLRGCEQTKKLFPSVDLATNEDYNTEFLDLIVAIKLVQGDLEAINHINNYSTKHSEAIITESSARAELFMKLIDSAVVYHNASTRFTDGGEFGFGAEIGISTQKLHARGPLGLSELTSYKYIVKGNGQTR